jgi:hypothetical protein
MAQGRSFSAQAFAQALLDADTPQRRLRVLELPTNSRFWGLAFREAPDEVVLSVVGALVGRCLAGDAGCLRFFLSSVDPGHWGGKAGEDALGADFQAMLAAFSKGAGDAGERG